jgi:hypothetical protein
VPLRQLFLNHLQPAVVSQLGDALQQHLNLASLTWRQRSDSRDDRIHLRLLQSGPGDVLQFSAFREQLLQQPVVVLLELLLQIEHHVVILRLWCHRSLNGKHQGKKNMPVT